MIPKKIHYCWFGYARKTKLAKKCIDSWKKYCPDYEIIEWNEETFNISDHPYAEFCYKQKKWAFLSDYVRLWAVERYGGIYFDTDVELLKSPTHLLEHEAFYGFETLQYVNTGQGFGAQAHHPTVKLMLEQYNDLNVDSQGNYRLLGCPQLNTKALLQMGLTPNGQNQTVGGAKIYSEEYFNPYQSATGRLKKTKNTVSIHWYSMSWMSKKTILRTKITKIFHRIFGEHCFQWLKEMKNTKCRK